MNFFAEQARARRKTRWLVFWFALAVLGIVTAVYFAVTLVAPTFRTPALLADEPIWIWWNAKRFVWTLITVGGGIVAVSLYKSAQIARQGGAFVARELGGRPVLRETGDPQERRLINIVDEMSIAAGIPAPQVFVLTEEPGLNAFAAGTTPANSVVAVTRGLLDHLNRDQMQGVIGHEIGHITNGDSSLNLRLIGVLHGILFLTIGGRFVLQNFGRHRNGKNAFPLLMLALLLTVIGYIGVFFCRLIQSAVSREREYLADASAVQFTRNPDGLASALRQLAGYGSRIEHPNAEAASHLFFGASGRIIPFFSALYATHPPLEKRIARLDKSFDPRLSPRRPAAEGASAAQSSAQLASMADLPDAAFAASSLSAAADATNPTRLEYAQILIAELPPQLREAIHQPADAAAAIYALLLDKSAAIRQTQLNIIEQTHTAPTAVAALTHARWLAAHGPQYRLPLLDLTAPTLREMSPDASQRFLSCIDALIKADGRLSPAEFALRHILKSSLQPCPSRWPSLRLERINTDIALLLAMLARAGNTDQAAMHTAFQYAATLAPTTTPLAFPEPKALRPEAIASALDHLAHAAPRFREKLIKACVAAVEHDGKITVAEAELLRAFAQSLDCPAPPVFPGAVPA
ncbi:Zn-dependent protease [Betaproteobacteria bacterium]|nr:Zn-dependent protease [Betaproteobacteria bacterium]GHU16652.1 Zn-dependent protease [Betaproteobacteria bacterium]